MPRGAWQGGRGCHFWNKQAFGGPATDRLLKTLYMLEPRQGHGIARRIEQTTGDNNRKTKFNKLTRAGNEPLKRERQSALITVRFIAPGEEQP